MNPLSDKELEDLKNLQLKDFASLPLFYSKEISYVFLDVVPKLLAIAEDHIRLHKTISGIKQESLTTDQRFRKLEDDYIQSLEIDIEQLRNLYKVKNEGVKPLVWYKRLFYWLGRKI